MENKELSMRLTALDELVGELTCDEPQPEVLKAQMSRLGIEYSDDPAERMSRVLFLIQKIQFDYTHDLPEFESAPMKQNDRTKKVRKDGIEI